MTADAPHRAGAAKHRLLRRAAITVFYIAVAVLCFIAIRQSLKPGGFGEIIPALTSMPPGSLALSGLSVAAVFAVIWAMEQAALYDGHAPASARWLIAAPLTASALSLGAGFGVLSGTALRMRLYGKGRLDGALSAFVSSGLTLMSMLGAALLASLGCVLGMVQLSGPAETLAPALPLIGAAALAGLALLAFLAGAKGRTVKIWTQSIRLPSAFGLTWRVGLGAFDWALSSLALYVLLPPHVAPPFLEFAATFAAFQLLALSTGAPGGLGVFEAMMLSLGHGDIPSSALAAALICYRITAFIVPVGVGMIAAAALEAFRRHMPHHDQPEKKPAPQEPE